MFLPDLHHVPDHQALSSLIGSISVACWIVVYSPQIIENYRLKSGEGVSVGFVVIWLIGDLASLGGALLAHLIPTIILLSAYYTICDIILLFQIYYYRWKGTARHAAAIEQPHGEDEESPLLPAPREEAQSSVFRQSAKYAAAIVFVYAAGIAAWLVNERLNPGRDHSKPEEVLEWRSQVMGWVSAVMYLAARVPQIRKNFETKCEGLSPLLWMFSISGNTTYALSIVTASVEPRYLVANASWLAGSTLTVFLDVFVLCQFFYYRARVYVPVPVDS